MFDHKTILDKAVDDGVINADQRWKLAPYFEGGIAEAKSAELDVSLDAPRDLGLAKQIEESEAPRFIRGFHDVLITIGLVIALIGLSALTNVIVVLVGAWVLAEVLVKRQRLALPAVALTLIYAGNALFAVFLFSETFILAENPHRCGLLYRTFGSVLLAVSGADFAGSYDNKWAGFSVRIGTIFGISDDQYQ
jgi:hypothetical protein